jgi:nicotinamidase-related amidase
MRGLLEGVAHFEQVGLMIRASSRTSIVKTLFFRGINTDQCVLHSLTDAHSSATVACWSRIAVE